MSYKKISDDRINNMKSKTIILSSEGNKGRGILTIYEEDGLLKCKLRLYEISNLNRFCKLGIYHNKEVFSANILEKDGVYLSSFVGDFNIDGDFYTAIVDTSKNNQVILSGGTYSGYFFNNHNSVFENIEKEDPTTTLCSYDDEEGIDIIQTSKAQNAHIEESPIVECETECDRCANCKYKEFFYSYQEKVETSPSSIETKTTILNEGVPQPVEPQKESEEQKENKHSILNSLIPQFKYVFENYQQDEILNNLIPNGKFVRIEENNESFSIGAIYEEDEMKYICYAVLRDYNEKAPEELGEHYQWLPLDKDDPLSDGYYMVFQDARDLKIVEI